MAFWPCPICQASHPLPLESEEACAYFLTLRDQPSVSLPAYRSYDGRSGPEEEVPLRTPAVALNGGRVGRRRREAKTPVGAIPFVEEGTESLSR